MAAADKLLPYGSLHPPLPVGEAGAAAPGEGNRYVERGPMTDLTEIANHPSGNRSTLLALARYLVRRGARVRITDQKTREQLGLELQALGDLPVELGLGGHGPADLDGADAVFVTPGAPRELPFLKMAAERGIPIGSEIE